jgi:hypothetical protein
VDPLGDEIDAHAVTSGSDQTVDGFGRAEARLGFDVDRLDAGKWLLCNGYGPDPIEGQERSLQFRDATRVLPLVQHVRWPSSLIVPPNIRIPRGAAHRPDDVEGLRRGTRPTSRIPGIDATTSTASKPPAAQVASSSLSLSGSERAPIHSSPSTTTSVRPASPDRGSSAPAAIQPKSWGRVSRRNTSR